MRPTIACFRPRFFKPWIWFSIFILILLIYSLTLTILHTKNFENVKSLKSWSMEFDDRVGFDPPVEEPKQLEVENHAKTMEILIGSNMCPPKYGKLEIFVAVVTESYRKFYHFAQATLNCYLHSRPYTLRLVDLNTDERVKKYCSHSQLFFRKHCAAAQYLKDVDWLLVLDADTGIVNPNHCIEDYIDNNVDLIFYERFFNWEIASGNYLVKNTPFARNFLMKWADYQYEQPSNWNGADNGVLQIHLLRTLLPNSKVEDEMCDKVWHNGTDYDTYMRFVMCCKVALGSQRVWPKVKIFRRAHGWVWDWHLTNDNWCSRSFMYHGWKLNDVGESGWSSPYTRIMNGSDCEAGTAWPWREEKHISCPALKVMLKNNEKNRGMAFPKVASQLTFLQEVDIGDCWPDCLH